jgi:hypothetical protein
VTVGLPPSVTLGGLNLSSVDAFGVAWFTEKVKGWSGASNGTLAPSQKPRSAGASAGLSYAKDKPIIVSGTAVAPSADIATLAVDRFNTAATLDESVMTVVEPSRTRWTTVRRDSEIDPVWLSDNTFEWSVQLVALDSRKFGAQLTGSTGLPSSSGGFSFPMSFPFSINAVQTSGMVSLTNPGNAIGPVLMRINGPGAAPIITHMGTGIALVFSASAVLGVGEFWTIDMENHRVLAQGQSGRSGYITSRGWSGMDPGVNIWSLSAPTFSAMTLDVSATPAWQ